MARGIENSTYPFGVNWRANGSKRCAEGLAAEYRAALACEAVRGQGAVMPLPSPSDVTRLLRQWSEGDREALNQLVPLMYAELRHLAHHRLRHEPANRSLNTTGLVHDAYMKLMDVRHAQFRDRAHFLAMASRVMRRLLVDQARARRAAKRGGGAEAVELEEALCVSEPQADALAELDEALERLETLDPRQGQIVEQRYFGGLSLEETAEALGVSLATVKRELRFAHAWLAAELGATDAGSGKGA
jgi:RNA polymerase sigma factor (TIGR02999 family)